MLAFDAYKCYLSVRRHFDTPAYDYFKYHGQIKCTMDSFTKRKDTRTFVKIAGNRDPETFIIGNVLFNPDQWVGSWTEVYQKEYEKHLEAGEYWFKSSLSQLKSSFNSNFIVDPDHSIPYILTLLRNGKIPLLTACAFEKMLNCDARWGQTMQYMIFQDLSKRIVKSVGFFSIDTPKYKAIVTDAFNN